MLRSVAMRKQVTYVIDCSVYVLRMRESISYAYGEHNIEGKLAKLQPVRHFFCVVIKTFSFSKTNPAISKNCRFRRLNICNITLFTFILQVAKSRFCFYFSHEMQESLPFFFGFVFENEQNRNSSFFKNCSFRGYIYFFL